MSALGLMAERSFSEARPLAYDHDWSIVPIQFEVFGVLRLPDVRLLPSGLDDWQPKLLP